MPFDVSDYQYTISTQYNYTSEQVHTNSDIMKLGEFSFQHYNIVSIRKIEKIAQCEEYHSGSALVWITSFVRSALSFQHRRTLFLLSFQLYNSGLMLLYLVDISNLVLKSRL